MSIASSGTSRSPVMLRSGFELHQPPLSALKSFMAPTADMFYVTHLGIVGMSSAGWSLKIGGLVEQPVTLSRAHLQKFPARHIVAVHEYAGSPLAPTTPVRLVGNVEWQGGPLASIRADAGILPPPKEALNKPAANKSCFCIVLI